MAASPKETDGRQFLSLRGIGVMTNVRELHTERLKVALENIKGIREKNVTALDSDFEIWKENVQESLNVLFGKDHGRTDSFGKLAFWLIRADCGGTIHWSRIDKRIFDKDLAIAEDIISGALEELPRN